MEGTESDTQTSSPTRAPQVDGITPSSAQSSAKRARLGTPSGPQAQDSETEHGLNTQKGK